MVDSFLENPFKVLNDLAEKTIKSRIRTNVLNGLSDNDTQQFLNPFLKTQSNNSEIISKTLGLQQIPQESREYRDLFLKIRDDQKIDPAKKQQYLDKILGAIADVDYKQHQKNTKDIYKLEKKLNLGILDNSIPEDLIQGVAGTKPKTGFEAVKRSAGLSLEEPRILKTSDKIKQREARLEKERLENERSGKNLPGQFKLPFNVPKILEIEGLKGRNVNPLQLLVGNPSNALDDLTGGRFSSGAATIFDGLTLNQGRRVLDDIIAASVGGDKELATQVTNETLDELRSKFPVQDLLGTIATLINGPAGAVFSGVAKGVGKGTGAVSNALGKRVGTTLGGGGKVAPATKLLAGGVKGLDTILPAVSGGVVLDQLLNQRSGEDAYIDPELARNSALIGTGAGILGNLLSKGTASFKGVGPNQRLNPDFEDFESLVDKAKLNNNNIFLNRNSVVRDDSAILEKVEDFLSNNPLTIKNFRRGANKTEAELQRGFDNLSSKIGTNLKNPEIDLSDVGNNIFESYQKSKAKAFEPAEKLYNESRKSSTGNLLKFNNVQKEVSEIQRVLSKSSNIDSKLKKLVDDIESKTKSINLVTDSKGNITKSMYDDLEGAILKYEGINDLLKNNFQNGTSSFTNNEVRLLNKLRKAYNQDLSSLENMKIDSKAIQKYKEANKSFSEASKKFSGKLHQDINALMSDKNSNPEDIFKKLVKGSTRANAQKFVDSLDEGAKKQLKKSSIKSILYDKNNNLDLFGDGPINRYNALFGGSRQRSKMILGKEFDEQLNALTQVSKLVSPFIKNARKSPGVLNTLSSILASGAAIGSGYYLGDLPKTITGTVLAGFVGDMLAKSFVKPAFRTKLNKAYKDYQRHQDKQRAAKNIFILLDQSIKGGQKD